MRIPVTLLMILVSLGAYSQNALEVTYNRTAYFPNMSRVYFQTIFRDRVICDKNLSFYYNLGSGADPHKKKKDVALEGSFYYDPEKQTTYTVHLMPKEIGNILFKDSFITGNWIFTDKTKRIKGYECKLALTYNSARDTTFVWYSEEIPFRFGPARFTGFPGMVLEVLDVIGRQQWKVSTIKERKKPLELPPFEILTRKEYIEKY